MKVSRVVRSSGVGFSDGSSSGGGGGAGGERSSSVSVSSSVPGIDDEKREMGDVIREAAIFLRKVWPGFAKLGLGQLFQGVETEVEGRLGRRMNDKEEEDARSQEDGFSQMVKRWGVGEEGAGGGGGTNGGKMLKGEIKMVKEGRGEEGAWDDEGGEGVEGIDDMFLDEAGMFDEVGMFDDEGDEPSVW